ncbi:diguanylate cyclase/phosphodiesterase [Pseudomonas sp. XWY-1]|nr:diguanylate cyclase/phosphodiesterase [Pseudomonas sp. XWY-1]
MCLPPICVGAGLPANTVAAATVNGGWKLARRRGPFAGKPAPTNHEMCVIYT